MKEGKMEKKENVVIKMDHARGFTDQRFSLICKMLRGLCHNPRLGILCVFFFFYVLSSPHLSSSTLTTFPSGAKTTKGKKSTSTEKEKKM